ncbi:hypothetical protein GCM10010435_87960 [Winogradskya consettensis]
MGTVRSWNADEGWGVLDGPDVPGGCWAHFSAVAATGHRELGTGRTVVFRAEAANQDGYPFRAVKIWTGENKPPDPQAGAGSSDACSSTLTLTFDKPERQP